MNREHPKFIHLASRRRHALEARRQGKTTEESLQKSLARIAREEAGTERRVATETAFRQTFDREHGLTDAESEVLTQAILECPCPLSARYLHVLLDDWTRFVREVEAGYKGTWNDYYLEIYLRSCLQRIVDGLPLRIAPKLMEAIAPLDKRFGAVTQPSRMMEADSDRTGTAWWWERVLPRYPGPELVDSMRHFTDLDPEYTSDPR